MQELEHILKRSQEMKLIGYELQARLAQAENQLLVGQVTPGRSALERVRKDAARLEFRLIARKAGDAERTAFDKTFTTPN